MTLGARLKRKRDAAGFSQDTFAAALEKAMGRPVPQTQVSRWERDCIEPRAGELLALASVLGVTSDWLLSGGPEPGVRA